MKVGSYATRPPAGKSRVVAGPDRDALSCWDVRVAAAITLALAAGCLEAPPSGSGGLPPVETCSFEDDFKALEPDTWQLNPDEGGSIGVDSGLLSLAANPVSGNGFVYIDVTSIDEWELAGLTITADLEVSWGGDGKGDAALVVAGGTSYIGIIADSSILAVVEDDAYLCDPEPCETPYVREAHRFWRIREAGGELHFETSAEGGGSWDPVGPSQPTPPGERAIVLWSECGEGNQTRLLVEHLTVECGDS